MGGGGGTAGDKGVEEEEEEEDEDVEEEEEEEVVVVVVVAETEVEADPTCPSPPPPLLANCTIIQGREDDVKKQMKNDIDGSPDLKDVQNGKGAKKFVTRIALRKGGGGRGAGMCGITTTKSV